MRLYLLDTSALLTLRDDEEGADQVARLLYQAQRGQIRCLGCFMTLMEFFCRIWKDEGEAAARFAYEQCYSLPITWVHENRELLEGAAKLKATFPLSVADAWIAAAALTENAELVHKDPELESLPCKQLLLPYK
jgi:predicted nucleic acid-binding protein